MRQLQNSEIQAVSGGLTSSQTSYLIVMAVQATTSLAATLMLGSSPQGLVIKNIVLPTMAILATAFAYELHNQVVEPRIYQQAACA